MTDYGHDLWFGVFVPPLAEQHVAVTALARSADELGLDLFGVQDHPYQPRFLDTWTLLANVARETEQIRLFPDVANLPLRPPAVLARAAASLDILSAGRVELGLGAGTFWDAIVANGGPRRTPGEAVDALEEAIGVIRALWSDERSVTVEGRHYGLRGAHPGPPPLHHIGLWLGAYRPRMLRLTGRLADGWVPSAAYAPPGELPAMSAAVDAAAEAAGRDPAEIRRAYNVDGSFDRPAGGFLQGPPRVWAEQLAALVLDEGLSAFLLSVAPGGEADARRFAEEVAPAVRETVERERRGAPAPAEPVPSFPAPPAAHVIESGRAGQQLLVQIHDHLRAELAQLREAIGQVEAGLRDAATIASLLARLTTRQNQCSLGSFCAGYCRLVTIHHAIEDRRLFPDLRRADEALDGVLRRLEQEHEVIAEVLAELDEALAEMLADRTRTARLRQGLDDLAEVLLRHLSYEEEQLLEPIGRHGIAV